MQPSQTEISSTMNCVSIDVLYAFFSLSFFFSLSSQVKHFHLLSTFSFFSFLYVFYLHIKIIGTDHMNKESCFLFQQQNQKQSNKLYCSTDYFFFLDKEWRIQCVFKSSLIKGTSWLFMILNLINETALHIMWENLLIQN